MDASSLMVVLCLFVAVRCHVNEKCYFGQFPAGFVWGAGTSDTQTEGAWRTQGKGESIFGRLVHAPGNVFNNNTDNIVCDHYKGYMEDGKILKNLHVGDYQLFMEWVCLNTTDRMAAADIQYYNRLFDELLSNRIRPLVTLYHWDLLRWLNESVVDDFVDCANLTFCECRDKVTRVKFWITFNEPPIICNLGYGEGAKRDLTQNPYIVAMHLIMAHARTHQLHNNTNKDSHEATRLDNVKRDSTWSLLEWLTGYIEKFGIHHVDFSDPDRPRTQSPAKWYTGPIDDNGYWSGYSRSGGQGTAVDGDDDFYRSGNSQPGGQGTAVDGDDDFYRSGNSRPGGQGTAVDGDDDFYRSGYSRPGGQGTAVDGDDDFYRSGYSRPGGQGTAVDGDDEFYYGTFPDDFIWAVASAAYQVEGAVEADGRGESIWDSFTPIDKNRTGKIACDSYHKYHDDVNLLKNMGVSHYRFSIAWSRIFPDGTIRSKNQGGIAYYHRLIDALLEAGIKPMVTLYHWDLPQALQDWGGWTNRSIINNFRDYADVCFEEYGSKVDFWVTFNEPWVFLMKGLGMGEMAPGHKNIGHEPYQGGHNVLLAHAEAYHLFDNKYRAQSPEAQVSISLNIDWAQPKDPFNPQHIEASEWAMHMFLGWFANPIYGNGDYPDVMKRRIAAVSAAQGLTQSRLPTFTDEQKAFIKGTYDYFGLNHYTTHYVSKQDETAAGKHFPNYFNDRGVDTEFDPQWIQSGSSWLRDTPWGVRKILNWIKHNYGDMPIYMTENGFSDRSGILDDQHRVHFFRYYINEVMKAIYLDNANVRSYTAWCLMDNFEWLWGYTERFGLHYVDFDDPNLTRIPKASAAFYGQVIQDNGFKKGAPTDPNKQPLPHEDDFLYGHFPEGFAWGAFSSALQAGEDGNLRGDHKCRRDSLWDGFRSADDGPMSYQHYMADDGPMSYQHYMADVQALKHVGATVYYLSLSWPRILPHGHSGNINLEGIKFYHKLLTAITEAGIQPIVTLHHWDVPAVYNDGWLNAGIVEAFENYSRMCFSEFGTQVKMWIPLNDPNQMALLGYEQGIHAPRIKGEGYAAAHNMLRAHASVYRIYQREFRHSQGGKVGLAVRSAWFMPKTSRDPGDWFGQALSFAYKSDWMADPVFLDGNYPAVMRQEVSLRSKYRNMASRLPVLTTDEQKLIKGSADFLGISYFTAHLVERVNNYPPTAPPSIADDISVTASADRSWPRTNLDWLRVYPQGLRRILRRAKERYGNIPIYVTGNGVSDDLGTTDDKLRVSYIVHHTNEILKAITLDNVDVRGYVVYSLVDGIEWQDGYNVSFGLFAINQTDPGRARIPKLSSRHFANVVGNNGFIRTSMFQAQPPPVTTILVLLMPSALWLLVLTCRTVPLYATR